MRARGIAMIAVALSLIASDADAQLGNQVQRSFETQLFEPAIGLDRFFSVEGGQVAEHLAFGVELMMNYQRRPLVLYTETRAGAGTGGFDINNAQELDLVSNQMTADLVAVMGLHYRWLHSQIGFDLPVNVLLTGQNIDDQGRATGESLSATGMGDLKVQIKVSLFPRVLAGFSLALSPIISVPTGNKSNFGGDPTVSVRPRLVAGFQHGAFNAAVNAGYLIREHSVLLSSEISNQLLYGAGASYRVHKRVAILGELFGRAGFGTQSGCADDPLTKQRVCDGTSNKDLDAFPLELDLGGRFMLPKGLNATVGGGLGLIKGIGSPQFRVIAGLQWAPDLKDSDGDGIPDSEDACPVEPEDKDGFQDTDGCPDLDNDGDLIPDAQDKCPNEPEDKDTFQDDDGCPDLDNDKDGIPDLKDACPLQPETKNGFSDEDGCPDVPDKDGDQIADAVDKCPNEPEDIDKFQDEDGCPDVDNDGDGIPDQFDDCPNAPEDMDKFKDDDGCPDPDNDNDGVPDAKDKCPNEPETINGINDEDGCPDKGPSHVTVEKGKIVITKKIYFATAKAIIQRQSFSILTEVALTMNKNQEIKKVQIEGHTDSRGDAKKNKQLSQERAEAVRAFLIGKGVDEARMTAIGFGSEKPIESNNTNRGREANRRVEFVIKGVAEPAPPPPPKQAAPKGE